jgi:hypothetical protein
MLIACAFYFHGKPFDFKSAIISDLESPEENPSGYGASAAGTAVCGLLLMPVAMRFTGGCAGFGHDGLWRVRCYWGSV